MNEKNSSLTKSLPLTLDEATVIHADKYSEVSGGYGNLPVSTTIHTDVVFRLTESMEDRKLYINGLNLPVYQGQKVTLVSNNGVVLAFVDMQTNHFYYTSSNYKRLLGLGWNQFLVPCIGLAGVVIIFFINGMESTLWMLLPLMLAAIAAWLQKLIIHGKIKKQLHHFLTAS